MGPKFQRFPPIFTTKSTSSNIVKRSCLHHHVLKASSAQSPQAIVCHLNIVYTQNLFCSLAALNRKVATQPIPSIALTQFRLAFIARKFERYNVKMTPGWLKNYCGLTTYVEGPQWKVICRVIELSSEL